MLSKRYEKLFVEFNEKWPIEKVKNLKLNEFVDINNPNTFCQWVETKTKPIGSINGAPSIKFGIYRMAKLAETKNGQIADSKYCWSSKFGATRTVAYKRVLEEVCKLIKAACEYNLDEIDRSPLHVYFKWKIASLYTYGNIPPIYNKQVIESIGNAFNVKVINKSNVLNEIMERIPLEQCKVEYSHFLFNKFYQKDKPPKSDDKKNEGEQTRKFKGKGYTATQRHNEIQNKLLEYLRKKYPNQDVWSEKDYVDIYRESSSCIYLYEVKSSQSPIYCIREALGQLLSYSFKIKSRKKKKLIIVGSSELRPYDHSFVEYIKSSLNINFEYMKV